MDPKPKVEGCPFDHKSLRNLSTGADRRGREVSLIRKLLLESNGEIEVDPHGDQDHLLDIRYAAESIYLNYAWEFLCSQEILNTKIAPGPFFWRDFFNGLDREMHERQELFYRLLRKKRTQPLDEAPRTCIENIGTLLEDIVKVPGMGPFDHPSLLEINTFGTKILQALYERYLSTYREPLSEKEFAKFTQHPSMDRTLVDWQYNSRDGVWAVKKAFGYRTDMNATRSNASLDPYAFDIDRGSGYFAPSGKSIETAKYVVKATVDMQTGGALAQRNCPVVYAQQFHEMWDWLCKLASYQLYNTTYPVRGDQVRSAVQRGMHDKIHQELRIISSPAL